jgi:hypothetical protein
MLCVIPPILIVRLCNTYELNYTIMINNQKKEGGLGGIVTKIEGINAYNNVGRNWEAGGCPPASS